MSRKKTVTLFSLLAMVALLSLGLAYANWNDNLTISGNVQTGTLDVAFQSNSWGENCTVTVMDNGNTLDVQMANAYPGLTCTVHAVVKNVGSVPAKYAGINPYSEIPSQLDADFTGCQPPLVEDTLGVDGTIECTATIAANSTAAQGTGYGFNVMLFVTTP